MFIGTQCVYSEYCTVRYNTLKMAHIYIAIDLSRSYCCGCVFNGRNGALFHFSIAHYTLESTSFEGLLHRCCIEVLDFIGFDYCVYHVFALVRVGWLPFTNQFKLRKICSVRIFSSFPYTFSWCLVLYHFVYLCVCVPIQ